MNRVGSANIAFAQAGEKCKGAVLASDAFFPFRDSIDAVSYPHLCAAMEQPVYQIGSVVAGEQKVVIDQTCEL